MRPAAPILPPPPHNDYISHPLSLSPLSLCKVLCCLSLSVCCVCVRACLCESFDLSVCLSVLLACLLAICLCAYCLSIHHLSCFSLCLQLSCESTAAFSRLLVGGRCVSLLSPPCLSARYYAVYLYLSAVCVRACLCVSFDLSVVLACLLTVYLLIISLASSCAYSCLASRLPHFRGCW